MPTTARTNADFQNFIEDNTILHDASVSPAHFPVTACHRVMITMVQLQTANKKQAGVRLSEPSKNANSAC